MNKTMFFLCKRRILDLIKTFTKNGKEKRGGLHSTVCTDFNRKKLMFGNLELIYKEKNPGSDPSIFVHKVSCFCLYFYAGACLVT
jgi:hypothetical protein